MMRSFSTKCGRFSLWICTSLLVLCYQQEHLVLCLSVSSASSLKRIKIAPELSQEHITHVSDTISSVLRTKQEEDRYSSIRSLIRDDTISSDLEAHQLVYGELSVPTLAKVLDAVGVPEDTTFLDIGSGDGALVMGAKLLYPEHITTAVGLEIVPGLVDRSKQHLKRLYKYVDKNVSLLMGTDNDDAIDFFLGDVHRAEDDLLVNSLLKETTLAVCFATTWSASNSNGSEKTSLQGRQLPQLSQALGESNLPKGARVIIVDGRLGPNDNGDQSCNFRWEGDLRIDCPDTAPYSIASLYTKL